MKYVHIKRRASCQIYFFVKCISFYERERHSVSFTGGRNVTPHGKNGVAKIAENLIRYGSENNFVRPPK